MKFLQIYRKFIPSNERIGYVIVIVVEGTDIIAGVDLTCYRIFLKTDLPYRIPEFFF